MKYQLHIVAQAARTAYMVIRAYDLTIGGSNPLWEDLEQCVRDGYFEGTKRKLETSITAADQHADWCVKQLAKGFTYSAVPSDTTSQFLIPHDQLPAEQRVKDNLFEAVCDSFR